MFNISLPYQQYAVQFDKLFGLINCPNLVHTILLVLNLIQFHEQSQISNIILKPYKLGHGIVISSAYDNIPMHIFLYDNPHRIFVIELIVCLYTS